MALFSFNLLTPVREAYGVHTGWALLRAGRVQGECRGVLPLGTTHFCNMLVGCTQSQVGASAL